MWRTADAIAPWQVGARGAKWFSSGTAALGGRSNNLGPRDARLSRGCWGCNDKELEAYWNALKGLQDKYTLYYYKLNAFMCVCTNKIPSSMLMTATMVPCISSSPIHTPFQQQSPKALNPTPRYPNQIRTPAHLSAQLYTVLRNQRPQVTSRNTINRLRHDIESRVGSTVPKELALPRNLQEFAMIMR